MDTDPIREEVTGPAMWDWAVYVLLIGAVLVIIHSVAVLLEKIT